MIYRAVTHGAFGHITLRVKLEKVPAHDVVRQPATVDRGHEFDVLFFNLKGGRNGGITTIGKKGFRLQSGRV